jgi:general secretion pathway protein G
LYKIYGGIGFDHKVKAESDIMSLQTQLKMYKEGNGFYPTTEQGLEALVTKPHSSPIPEHWFQHYSSLPLDSWQHPYVYRFPVPQDPSTFDLLSFGADGVESDDDIRVPH